MKSKKKQEQIPNLSYETVLSAFKLWYSTEKLGRHPLTTLKIVKQQNDKFGRSHSLVDFGHSLREVLRKALNSIKSTLTTYKAADDIPIYFSIIHGEFVEGKTIKHLEIELNFSRRTIYRYRRNGLEKIADILRQWESEAFALEYDDAETPFLLPALSSNSLIGRDEIIKDIKKCLSSVDRLPVRVALYGLPGVGKSSLILDVAHHPEIQEEFSDGILWSGVGKTPDEMMLLAAWGRELGIGHEISEIKSIEARVDRIKSKIGNRKMLLIADDIWDIKDANIVNIGAPNCAHVITTRFPNIAIKFASGNAIKISELNEVNGIELLKNLVPQIELLRSSEVRNLVQSVGGLPLGLTLIGNYLMVEGRDSQTIRIDLALKKLNKVQSRLELDVEQIPTQRHPSLLNNAKISLKAILSLSIEALDSSLQSALHILTCFSPKPNTISWKAASIATGRSLNSLFALSDSGLLEPTDQDRFSLHQTVYDFARTQLTGTLKSQELLNYYSVYLKEIRNKFNIIDIEFNNIISVLELGRKQKLFSELIPCINSFYHYLQARGLYNLAERLLIQAREAANETGSTEDLVNTLLNLGRINEIQGRYTVANNYHSIGLDLAKKSNLDKQVCQFLLNLGLVADKRGEVDDSRQLYLKGLSLARNLDYESLIIVFLQNLGSLAQIQGKFEEAQKYYVKALKIENTNNAVPKIGILSNLGLIQQKLGNPKLSNQYFRDALSLAQSINHRSLQCMILVNLGALLEKQGELEHAKLYYEQALPIAQQIERKDVIGVLLSNLGVIEQKGGDEHLALEYFDEAIRLAKKLNHKLYICSFLNNRGSFYLGLQKYKLAKADFKDALDISKLANYKEVIADASFGLAKIAHYDGDETRACEFGRNSLLVYEKMNHEKRLEVLEWLENDNC